MKKKIVMLALFSVFLLSAMTVSALAQPLDVGVQVGDWFKYKAEVTEWESEDPFLPEGFIGPLSLADNETNYILYNVTDITPGDGGNNVTFTITYDWKNGSVTEATNTQNVSTANTQIFIIGANMEEGDMVSDAFLFFGFFDYPARYINETIESEYIEPPTRETNVLEYHIDIDGTPYDYVFHWDKVTGMRVYYENSGDVPAIFTAAYNYTVKWTLIETNIGGWTVIPEYPTGTVMLSVFIAITVSIALYGRKKLKH
ncbi:MAG: hypothetical protein OEW95_08140 [Candidatus Bathyarchaeota archaeon]|nr:hypothetical protein [Candidatus Bathyarchaeota archaeon]